jgi:hypothetical protein
MAIAIAIAGTCGRTYMPHMYVHVYHGTRVPMVPLVLPWYGTRVRTYHGTNGTMVQYHGTRVYGAYRVLVWVRALLPRRPCGGALKAEHLFPGFRLLSFVGVAHWWLLPPHDSPPAMAQQLTFLVGVLLCVRFAAVAPSDVADESVTQVCTERYTSFCGGSRLVSPSLSPLKN